MSNLLFLVYEGIFAMGSRVYTGKLPLFTVCFQKKHILFRIALTFSGIVQPSGTEWTA